MSYPRAVPGAHEHASSPPDHPLLFHAMHVDTARAYLAAGYIPSTRASLADPEHRIVGVQNYVRARLTAPVGRPYLGTVADNVALSFTPHTRSVYASCGPVVQPAAARIPRTEIAIAVVPHAAIVDAGLQVLYSDRSPVNFSALLSERLDPAILPWPRFRTWSSASRGSDPLELARYGAEVLVWAQPIVTQAGWFFGDKRRAG